MSTPVFHSAREREEYHRKQAGDSGDELYYRKLNNERKREEKRRREIDKILSQMREPAPEDIKRVCEQVRAAEELKVKDKEQGFITRATWTREEKRKLGRVRPGSGSQTRVNNTASGMSNFGTGK